MSFDTDQLLRLWNGPLPADDDGALAAFRAVYTDPVTVNGSTVPVSELVVQARAMQRTHEGAERTILDLLEVTDETGRHRLAFAFLVTARHDGEPVKMRGVDLATVTDGRISEIWAAAQPA